MILKIIAALVFILVMALGLGPWPGLGNMEKPGKIVTWFRDAEGVLLQPGDHVTPADPNASIWDGMEPELPWTVDSYCSEHRTINIKEADGSQEAFCVASQELKKVAKDVQENDNIGTAIEEYIHKEE